ncbi:transcription factor bHLH112 isoform X2 [Glycine max]|uniref:transcription factor bHLH112 isoform X2 n=1 Tax=Glycine max TaxID=3847 RepID=UPI001B357E75|nr:transcription factor bHLH112 isoform X2 [Glycine max]
MAEEFQARICGENLWSSTTIDSTRSSVLFPLSSSSSSSISSSPCSVAANNNDAGNYSTRGTSDTDLKATKCCAEDTNGNNLVSDTTYLGFVDLQKPHNKSESAASGSGGMLIDSTLQMMGFGLTSSTSSSENWNQPLLFRCNGRAESNFHSLIQEETGMDSSNSQIHRDWIPKSFSSGGGNQQIDYNNFKPLLLNKQEFSLDHHSLSSLTTTGLSSNHGFPIGSASSYGNPSTLQSLYDPNYNPHPQHNSLFTNRPMFYSSKACYGTPCTELPQTWSKVSTFLKPTTTTIAKQQHPNIGLHFSNNTPFWNASAEALHDIRVGTFASSQSQYHRPTFDGEKPNCPSTLLNKFNSEKTLESASMMTKKNVCEPALKRPRIETSSPLPTFKVRKEKLGDRVTALQQLVSPFGKTDTASVLHEAIEYIKFLHDQVNGCDDLKDSEGPQQDLKSKGLCLVPISSTFPVATEATSAELWTPTFRSGALLR